MLQVYQDFVRVIRAFLPMGCGNLDSLATMPMIDVCSHLLVEDPTPAAWAAMFVVWPITCAGRPARKHPRSHENRMSAVERFICLCIQNGGGIYRGPPLRSAASSAW